MRVTPRSTHHASYVPEWVKLRPRQPLYVYPEVEYNPIVPIFTRQVSLRIIYE